MKNLYINITLVSLSLLTSCMEEISLESEFEEQVFISGILTSEADFVSVQIQKTVQVADTSFSAVNDAQVSLFTRDASDKVSMISDSFIVTNGEYQTSETITPVFGNTYWIEVVLRDQTVLTSEEETLSPVQITAMVKNRNRVQITFTDSSEEQNFYLIHLEAFKDKELVIDEFSVFSDRFLNEESEKTLELNNNIEDGHTVRVSLHKLNFNTFQFYRNLLGIEIDDDLVLPSLFLPINIVGNITNTKTKRLVLGNFGVAGISTMTMDF